MKGLLHSLVSYGVKELKEAAPRVAKTVDSCLYRMAKKLFSIRVPIRMELLLTSIGLKGDEKDEVPKYLTQEGLKLRMGVLVWHKDSNGQTRVCPLDGERLTCEHALSGCELTSVINPILSLAGISASSIGLPISERKKAKNIATAINMIARIIVCTLIVDAA